MSDISAGASAIGAEYLQQRRQLLHGLLIPALRFIVTYVLLLTVLYASGDRYSAWWCKPLEFTLSALPSAIIVDRVTVEVVGDQRVFRMSGKTRDVIHSLRGKVPAGTTLDSTTLQAYAHHHFILIFAVLAAWPVGRTMDRAMLLAAGIPAVLIATLFDLPFTLIGVAQDAILAATNPDALGSDPGVLYFQFLQRGGRQALSLALAALVIVSVRLRPPAERTSAGGNTTPHALAR